MNNVEGKVVVITGASSGIGEQTARDLVAAGAKVALTARREDRLANLVAELGEENACYLTGDVTNPQDMTNLVNLAKKRFGKVDVLLANAGIMPAGPMAELRVDDWMSMVDVNIKGVLASMAAVLPGFLEQGSGHIIATSSVAGTQLVPGNAVYCGTKHFVRTMLSSFRSEQAAAGQNIRTTIIYPGMIKTELLNSVAEGEGKQMAQAAYDALALTPDVIASAVLYAVSQPNNVDVSDIIVRPTLEG